MVTTGAHCPHRPNPVAALFVLLVLPLSAVAQEGKLQIAEVPECLPALVRTPLLDRKLELEEQRLGFNKRIEWYAANCEGRPREGRCASEEAQLGAERVRLVGKADSHRRDVESSIGASRLCVALRYFYPGKEDAQKLARAIATVCSACGAKATDAESRTQCNWFVSSVAEHLGIPYLRDLKPRGAPLHVADREGRQANKVWDTMEQFANRPGSGWVLLESGEQAQELADKGFFVFGVAKNLTTNPCPAPPGNPSGCGHIAVVARSDSHHRTRCPYGTCRNDPPYVFDQKNATGSTGFNNAFRREGHTAPRWHVYVPPGDKNRH